MRGFEGAAERIISLILAGLAAIVGHIYPVWVRFRGGKGVATACGVFSLLTPLAAPDTASLQHLAALHAAGIDRVGRDARGDEHGSFGQKVAGNPDSAQVAPDGPWLSL